jgi:hypothetical protein
MRAFSYEEGKSEFRKMFDKWNAAYSYVELRILGAHVNGETILRCGELKFLASYEVPEFEPINVTAGALIGIRDLIPVHDFLTVNNIQAIIEGEIQYRNTKFYLKPDSQRGTSAYFEPDKPSSTFPESRNPNLRLSVSPSSPPIIDWNADFENELRSLASPFNGLSDLVGELVLSRTTSNTWAESSLDITLHAPISLVHTGSTIEDGTLKICFQADPTIDIHRFRVGLIIYPSSGRPIRTSVSGDEFTCILREPNLCVSHELPVAEAFSGRIIAIYQDEAISSSLVTTPTKLQNDGVMVYRTFGDTSFSKLRKLLNPPPTKGDDLERGAALLFSLAGFNCQVLAFSPFDNAPDMVGRTPRGRYLIVETTVSIPQFHSKVAKIKARASAIIETLSSAGIESPEVVPVLLTSASRAEVGTDEDYLAEKQVALLCQEEIEFIVESLVHPQDADAIFDTIARYIPATRSATPFDLGNYGGSII